MNKSLFLSVTAGICLLPHTAAQALSARQISTEQLQGVKGQIISLKLSPGYGLTINFLPVGETIIKAWLDDPSRIALSFDGELCQEQSNCRNTGANVVHLRQIPPIDLPYITHSPTGETLLTLIAQGAQGQRKLYQFTIIPTSLAPEFTAINVVPETEYEPLIVDNDNFSDKPQALPLQNKPPVKLNPNPRLEQTSSPQPDNNNLAEDIIQKTTSTNHLSENPKDNLASSSSANEKFSPLFQTRIDFKLAEDKILRVWSPPPKNPQKTLSVRPDNSTEAKTPRTKPEPNSAPQTDSLRLANDLVYGLLVATQKGEIEYHSNTYLKIQNLILLLRRGQTLEASTNQALVEMKLVRQLLDWGQTRPSANQIIQ
ncbi:MAG: hypothetical protein AB4368_00295 [Xenococcaceae cyanobacterium]